MSVRNPRFFGRPADSLAALAYERNDIVANWRDAGINVGSADQADFQARHVKIDGDRTAETLGHIDPICGLCLSTLSQPFIAIHFSNLPQKTACGGGLVAMLAPLPFRHA